MAPTYVEQNQRRFSRLGLGGIAARLYRSDRKARGSTQGGRQSRSLSDELLVCRLLGSSDSRKTGNGTTPKLKKLANDKLKFVGGWRRLLSLLVLVPWALPGTVVAVSVAEAYGTPGSLLGSFVLVGTFWILPLVYFLRFMPLVVRALQASMEQLDPTLDEAAGSLGARAWQRFYRVTLPLVAPGAIAGTLLAFVIALGEYVASVLVFVPINRPISIAIASELRDFNLRRSLCRSRRIHGRVGHRKV